jgi:exonuclease III
VGTLAQQVDAIVARKPDVVALQEVTKTTLPQFRQNLCEYGFEHFVDGYCGRDGIAHFTLIASRFPLQEIAPSSLDALKAGCHLAVIFKAPYGKVEFHNVHIPGFTSANVSKRGVLETLYDLLATEAPHYRILCGDFNAPQKELLDGTLITFWQTLRKNGEFKIKRGREREHQAEYAALTGLAEFDLVDTFRLLNGYDREDCSWYAKNRGRLFGFRLDHIFASKLLNAVDCRYFHDLREVGLSDHSAMEATFCPD